MKKVLLLLFMVFCITACGEEKNEIILQESPKEIYLGSDALEVPFTGGNNVLCSSNDENVVTCSIHGNVLRVFPEMVEGNVSIKVYDDKNETTLNLKTIFDYKTIAEKSGYNYYLFYKTKNNDTAHLYLSNLEMGIMENFSDDDAKRRVSMPSYYKPQENTTGKHYTFQLGKLVLDEKDKISGYISDIKGTNAKLENIDNWFETFDSNYAIPMYKNNTAGKITTYGTYNNN